MTLLLLLACQDASPKDPLDSLDPGETTGETGSPTDTPTDTDTTTYIDPGTLRGELVEDPFPAPDFSGVVNQDDAPRSREELLGHPTVIWFYPAANTGG